MKIFKDRKSAGKLLADRLKEVKADIVLGIPRGGVVVASEIAKNLKIPLDVLVTRKIGSLRQPELALGAVDPDGEVIWNTQLKFNKKDLAKVIIQEWKELKRREDLYRRGRELLNLENKTVILVDDGMATGETVLAGCIYLKRHGAKIILAIPIASRDALAKVVDHVENIEVLEVPEIFAAISTFYHNFEPITDDEVVNNLSSFRT